MALVDYSSEDSETEENPKQQEPAKSKPNSTKPAFHKVVDRSNPHKIRVSLPEPSKTQGSDQIERPAKRAKMGSGGFNSLLPAPKRAAARSGGIAAGEMKRGGLGSGVNLKTGAAPGFSREPPPTVEASLENGEEAVKGGEADQDTDQMLVTADEGNSIPKPVEAPKPKGKTTMFKPLSVARKPQKKKAPPKDGLGGSKAQSSEPVQQTKPVPKISLFPTRETYEISRPEAVSNGTYQPMVYSADEPNIEPPPEETPYPETYSTSNLPDTTSQLPESLTTIATDLNLSASQKRQLLGRQKPNSNSNSNPNPTPVNIVNFNTDAEYAANEILRQAGEAILHNPVRAIAPGKHSLKQLVNAASSQKDALEESFATGRRNKKEAGSKYGW